MTLPQSVTGRLTEKRVKDRLRALGLVAYKPVPDIGIDLIVYNPYNPNRKAKIQVKGRNPKKVRSYRWFQLRVSANEIRKIIMAGLPPDIAWQDKVNKADFFILDAVHLNEMWIFPKSKVFELIRMNGQQYGRRPDNVFEDVNVIKPKQKEMNLDALYNGAPIRNHFFACRNNFNPIMEFIGINN